MLTPAYSLHAADYDQTVLMESGCTAIAYETIQNPDGSLPLLVPMSEVAGKMSTQVGSNYLAIEHGGKGVLLGGVPGVRRAKVTVIGCGIAGTNAIKIAMGMGADVTAIDVSTKRLAELDDLFEKVTLCTQAQTIFTNLNRVDLVVGAV